MARPVWTPTDAQRRQAETMAAYGIPEADIARVLGVSKPTLRKHCGIELDTPDRRADRIHSSAAGSFSPNLVTRGAPGDNSRRGKRGEAGQWACNRSGCRCG